MSGPSVVLIAVPNQQLVDPRIGPPLGLLYLVAWAREHGVDTTDWRVVDLNVECYSPDAPSGHWSHDFSVDSAMKHIPGGADIYGLSLMSAQMPIGVKIAKALREREPQARLVCGGAHPSAMPEECCDWFDYVVEGEGEQVLTAILDDVYDLESPVLTLPTRVGPGMQMPMEHAPFPARDMLDFSKYTRKIAGEPATNIITSRGCPNRCAFCQQDSIWGKGVRMHSVQRVLAEVDDIHATTGIRNLLFLDDSFTARSTGHMIQLAQGLQTKGVKWRGWTRADLLCRRGWDYVLQKMQACGCQSLCVGVEAGTDKVLKAIGKNTTVAQNSEALKRIAESGMKARCSFMVGQPGETWWDVEALIQFIEEHRSYIDDWILSIFVPLPGTPVWEDPDRYGIIIDKARARRSLYRDFFVVGGNEQSGLVHRYQGSTEDEILLRHRYTQEHLLRTVPRNRARMVN